MHCLTSCCDLGCGFIFYFEKNNLVKSSCSKHSRSMEIAVSLKSFFWKTTNILSKYNIAFLDFHLHPSILFCYICFMYKWYLIPFILWGCFKSDVFKWRELSFAKLEKPLKCFQALVQIFFKSIAEKSFTQFKRVNSLLLLVICSKV